MRFILLILLSLFLFGCVPYTYKSDNNLNLHVDMDLVYERALIRPEVSELKMEDYLICYPQVDCERARDGYQTASEVRFVYGAHRVETIQEYGGQQNHSLLETGDLIETKNLQVFVDKRSGGGAKEKEEETESALRSFELPTIIASPNYLSFSNDIVDIEYGQQRGVWTIVKSEFSVSCGITEVEDFIEIEKTSDYRLSININPQQRVIKAVPPQCELVIEIAFNDVLHGAVSNSYQGGDFENKFIATYSERLRLPVFD